MVVGVGSELSMPLVPILRWTESGISRDGQLLPCVSRMVWVG
jgi:hypothetical protein